jgi:hypothetical protein
MEDLDREIRQLAAEIRAVEAMLVEAYGLAPVAPAVGAHPGSGWARRLRALCRRACRRLASLMESGDLFALRSPLRD